MEEADRYDMVGLTRGLDILADRGVGEAGVPEGLGDIDGGSGAKQYAMDLYKN